MFQKQNIVGDFFENVAHTLFGGELSRNDNGDLCLWKTGTSIEIKSSGFSSPYGFRLALSQLEKYERIATFPFERVWYVLFAYENRRQTTKTGRRSSEMATYTERAGVQGFLAERIKWCVVVDISVVSHWKNELTHSDKSIPCHPGDKSIDIQCKNLDPLFNGNSYGVLKTMGSFGISEKIVLGGYLAFPVTVDLLHTFPLKFPIKMVLPWNYAGRVQKRLYRRGFRLKREL